MEGRVEAFYLHLTTNSGLWAMAAMSGGSRPEKPCGVGIPERQRNQPRPSPSQEGAAQQLLKNTSPQQQLDPVLMWRPDVAPGTQSSLPKLRGVCDGPGSDAPGGGEDYGYHLCCASARDAQHQAEKPTAASRCGEVQAAKSMGKKPQLRSPSFPHPLPAPQCATTWGQPERRAPHSAEVAWYLGQQSTLGSPSAKQSRIRVGDKGQGQRMAPGCAPCTKNSTASLI